MGLTIATWLALPEEALITLIKRWTTGDLAAVNNMDEDSEEARQEEHRHLQAYVAGKSTHTHPRSAKFERTFPSRPS